MSMIVNNAHKCVKALEMALEAMEPSLGVYDCILRIIAEFVPYGASSPLVLLGQPHEFPT